MPKSDSGDTCIRIKLQQLGAGAVGAMRTNVMILGAGFVVPDGNEPVTIIGINHGVTKS